MLFPRIIFGAKGSKVELFWGGFDFFYTILPVIYILFFIVFIPILILIELKNCGILFVQNLIKMNRIKEVLEEKGIKQTWLADKLGKSFNTVNSYVQNRQQPRLEILNQIAEILDVDIKDLIISSK